MTKRNFMKNEFRNIAFFEGITPYWKDIQIFLNQENDFEIFCVFQSFMGYNSSLLMKDTPFVPHYLIHESKNKIRVAELYRIIRKYRPKYIISIEFSMLTVQLLLLKWVSGRNFKLIVRTDDSYNMLTENNDFSKSHKYARKILSHFVDDLIVVEQQVEQWHQKHSGKGFWLPIIADENKAVTRYERILPISRRYAEQYNLIGKKVLLSVSRLVDLKNLHRAIDAFGQTKNDATFIIVGDGPERNELVKHAGQVGKNIVFVGRFEGDELYAWYNLASVFILASYQEPFGAVTNEALLAGCRVVISKSAGSSCLVDETNGELISPMDVGGIASAIDRQLEHTTAPNLIQARNSLMTVSFNERMKSLSDKMNSL